VNTVRQRNRKTKTPARQSGRTPAVRAVTVRDTGPYSARNSSKGALIDEAGRVVSAMRQGHSVAEVRDDVLRGALLTQRSRENRERIWTSIHQRYLFPTTPWLTSALADACESGSRAQEFVSLLYLLYALRDRLTFDFVTKVLSTKDHQARPIVSRNDVLDLLKPRGIQAVAANARSDRQEKRRVELDDAIRELTDFDARLEQVSRQGFATAGLAKRLADEPLDRCCSLDGKRLHPTTTADLIAQESAYVPDINDGVRVNIAPLQNAGLLAADVLAKKDVDKAIADRANWRADERRWVREGKLPQPGWWREGEG